MAKPNKRDTDNLLDLIPVPSVDWGNNPDGTVYLIKLKFKSRFLTKLLKRLKISPFHKVHLDEFGSFVWIQCDGKKPVYDIGASLQDYFGEKIEPVYDRLGSFIQILAHHRYIHYIKKQTIHHDRSISRCTFSALRLPEGS